MVPYCLQLTRDFIHIFNLDNLHSNYNNILIKYRNHFDLAESFFVIFKNMFCSIRIFFPHKYGLLDVEKDEIRENKLISRIFFNLSSKSISVDFELFLTFQKIGFFFVNMVWSIYNNFNSRIFLNVLIFAFVDIASEAKSHFQVYYSLIC